MLNFPLLEAIDVDGYALYPGPSREQAGLHIVCRPGLTLVVGTNGLGKTTLVTLLYRLLTGPEDIPSLGPREQLGSLRLATSPLSPGQRGIFANRVADRAAGASAKLTLRMGQHQLVVERAVSNLALRAFRVDGVRQPLDESQYQKTITELCGVGSFADFILVLRYLTFYFEDRRALVWDPTAQRQILRLLFLPPNTAQSWAARERAILETDSRMRNLQAALTREDRSLSENTIRAQGGAPLRQQLKAFEDLQAADQEKLTALDDQTLEVESSRQKARQSFLVAEQERESRFRALERAKLSAIDARFPDQSEVGRYILAHLMSEADCLVCGTHSPDAAQAYSGRLSTHRCVVCDADLSRAEKVVAATELADKRVEQAAKALARADATFAGFRAELERAEGAHHAHVGQLAELNARIAERANQIDLLVRSLPPSEVAIRTQRDALSTLRGRVEAMKVELAQMRTDFQAFIEQMALVIAEASETIETAFSEYACGFLSEKATISRTQRAARIGQGGESIEFPTYELDMTGSDFDEKVRRAGPDEASESQREFIDLAFRMALTRAAGSSGAGSLVIDAPESSLDAVFARRAARILTRFASPRSENRLLITSNLIEGSLIPSLVQAATTGGEGADRIVDLFDIARPTAAIIEAREEYEEVRRRLLGGS